MVEFTGTDHAWSGIYGITLNGNALAVHGVYLVGTVNTGWTHERIRYKGLLGDGLYMKYSGSTGPNGLRINNCYAYSAQSLSNITCACVRSIFHFHLNNSVGQIHVSDIVCDNGGTDGVIFWETETNGRCDLIVTGAKAENWNSTGDATSTDADFVVVKHNVDTTVGAIVLNGVKLSQSGDTAWNSLVHNKSAVARRPIIHVNPLRINDAITKIYEEDNDSTYDLTYDAKFRDMSFVLNTSAHVGMLTAGTGFSGSPLNGEHYWDGANRKIFIHDGTDGHALRVGQDLVEKRGSNYTVVATDHEKVFTNGNAGASITFTLPDIATVGTGFRCSFLGDVAQAIVVARASTDVINNGSTSLTSGGAIGDALEVVSADSTGTLRWIVTKREGTWT